MDFLEKIVAGFGGLCLVTTAILYLLLQTPSPMPTEFVPGVLRVTPTVESGATTNCKKPKASPTAQPGKERAPSALVSV